LKRQLTVKELYYYPVKSCKGIPVPTLVLDQRGTENDRKFMIVDADGIFLTQREHPTMALIATRVSAGSLVLQAPGMEDFVLHPTERGDTMPVKIWKDSVPAIDQGSAVSDWISRFLGIHCQLVMMPSAHQRQVDLRYVAAGTYVNFQDGYNFLIAGTASLEAVNDRLPEPIDMRRFRPNIVIETEEPFVEDRWRKIKIGEITFTMVKACARCAITAVDPDKGKISRSKPLAVLKHDRKVTSLQDDGTKKELIMFGQNATHEIPAGMTGIIHLGDMVDILELADKPNFIVS